MFRDKWLTKMQSFNTIFFFIQFNNPYTIELKKKVLVTPRLLLQKKNHSNNKALTRTSLCFLKILHK